MTTLKGPGDFANAKSVELIAEALHRIHCQPTCGLTHPRDVAGAEAVAASVSLWPAPTQAQLIGRPVEEDVDYGTDWCSHAKWTVNAEDRTVCTYCGMDKPTPPAQPDFAEGKVVIGDTE